MESNNLNKNLYLLLLLSLLLSGCSSFINLTDTFKLSDDNSSLDDNLTNEVLATDNESSFRDNAIINNQDLEMNQ